MPLVVPCELPTSDVVIVVPAHGRVMVFYDLRVPADVAAGTVMRVRSIIHGPGDIRAQLADLVGGPPYTLGAAHAVG
jgi:hypothetical protein